MNHKVLDGSLCFRDSFREMLESVHHPFEECKAALQKSESVEPSLPHGPYRLSAPPIALDARSHLCTFLRISSTLHFPPAQLYCSHLFCFRLHEPNSSQTSASTPVSRTSTTGVKPTTSPSSSFHQEWNPPSVLSSRHCCRLKTPVLSISSQTT